jgi:hypothetical protein
MGADQRTVEELRALLGPRERIHYVFEAETDLNLRTFLYKMLAKGALGLTGEALVVVSSDSVVVVDTKPGWWMRLRPIGILDRLDHPTQFGPVSGEGWIVLGGRPMFVYRAKRVIRSANAALATAVNPP